MAGAPFIVWSPDGPTPPKVSHKTHQEAHSAACIMAKAHPGQQFYVMARCGKGAKVDLPEVGLDLTEVSDADLKDLLKDAQAKFGESGSDSKFSLIIAIEAELARRAESVSA